ncbi:lysophospholipase D GDPD1-like [Amphiura filiformis]|uniref:lysophospholipase D GDPD1-like n=1 Tax=Amphiura filiformis TaxID=82378 RepID=UPI003B21E791
MSVSLYVPLSLFGGYVVLSSLLLRFPNLVHRKKKPKIQAKLIAHRGGAGENLENTMAAYQHALDLGFDMLELDCHLTMDKQVVVSHDDHLGRVSGINALISETNYKDLPLMSTALSVPFCKGKWCQGDIKDRRIPLLREVFEQFPNIPINLDIKINNDELIARVIQLIREFERKDITVVGNFKEKIGKKCHKAEPDIPLCFSMQSVVKTVLLFYSGLLPFFPLKETFLEIPIGTVLSRNFEFTSFWVRSMIWLVDALLVSPIMFRHLQRRGIVVYLWVLNYEDEWERAIKVGANGIMTDYPTQLKNFMEERGLVNGLKQTNKYTD